LVADSNYRSQNLEFVPLLNYMKAGRQCVVRR